MPGQGLGRGLSELTHAQYKAGIDVQSSVDKVCPCECEKFIDLAGVALKC